MPRQAPSDIATAEFADRRAIATLALIVVLGAGVQVYRAANLPCISRDGVFFVRFAKQLADAPVFYMRAQKKQPGYAWLLLGTHAVIGERLAARDPLAWQRCGQLLAILGGTAIIVLIFVLARTLFDARTGLIAAGMAAFWPQCAQLSADVLSDTLHLAIYLAALLVGLHALRRRRWFALVACGLLGGAGYLVRQESLGIPMAVGACLLWPRRGLSWRRGVTQAAVVCAAFSAAVAPYAIAIGKVMHNKTFQDLLFGPPAHAAAAAGGPMLAGPVEWWTAPWTMLVAWGQSGVFVLSTWAMIGFLWSRVPRSEPTARRLVAVAAMLQLIATQLRGASFDVISGRYMLIPAALSIPWAAAGLRCAVESLVERVASRRADARAQRSRPRTIAVAVGLIAVSPMVYVCLRRPPAGADFLRRAGQWLADHRRAGDRLLAAPALDCVAFYGDLPHLVPGGDEATAASAVTAPGTWFADYSDSHRLSDAERRFLDRAREAAADREPESTWRSADGQTLRLYRPQ
ncbi:MAG: glycosyltransferase family 39 protein [Phycisphaerae bacterium]